MMRRSFLASIGSLASTAGLRPTFALSRDIIPSPAGVHSLETMNGWIDSWGCGRHTSRCAIEKTVSGRSIEHIELALGAAFSVNDLDEASLVRGEHGWLTEDSQQQVRKCVAYPEAYSKLYGYAARSIYGHAMAANGADVFWRIMPEDDVRLEYVMIDISPDGPDIDFVTRARGKKVLSNGLIKFYCRFSFDTKGYEVHQIDMADLPLASLWAQCKPEGQPIQISPRS